MKYILTSILFFFQLMLLTNCYAQIKEVVFIKKKTRLEKVYQLPQLAEINLIDDNPAFFSKVILDSVSNDTFYISNPKNVKQKLAVPFNIVNAVKITKLSFGKGLMGFGFTCFSLFIIGGILFKTTNVPIITPIPLILGGVGFIATMYDTKQYNIFSFEIKGRNR